MCRAIYFSALLFCFALSCAAASFAASDDDFIAARDAYRGRDQKQLDKLVPKLQGHVLESYAKFWQINNRIKEASDAEVSRFAGNYPDTPLGEQLLGDWLRQQGQQKNWQAFETNFAALKNPDTELSCFSLQARIAKKDEDALKEGRTFWFSGKSQPESCQPVFDAMMTQNIIMAPDVWARIRLALEAGGIGLARRLNQNLPANEQMNDKQLAAAYDTPQSLLEKNNFDYKSRSGREVAMFAVHRLAHTQSSLAALRWTAMQEKFNQAERSYVWGLIGFEGARNHEPLAIDWYRNADVHNMSDLQIAWRARAALRVQAWGDVLASIEQLSPPEQRESNWRYWKGRALKELGRTEAANEVLIPLSREYLYYGLLAAEELGAVPVSLPAQETKAKIEDVKTVEQRPEVQRALALHRLGMDTEGTKEWIAAVRNLNDAQLLAASELARKANWPERSINTADKTQSAHDFSLRYPTPFEANFREYAKKHGVDEAWVFGLARQESRFMADVRSRAGAMGLMQIMPATGQWLAKRAGWKNFQTSTTLQPETNISLGTYYLKYLLDELAHPVLATAAYNAGPSRAKRWRDNNPLEGAIYAETIPFTETRDYVKKVMSNTQFYSARLGLPIQPLKQRLGTIASRPSGTTDVDSTRPDN
ncbi:MAG: transglycosylase SLT domain-containing protein [Burkholderiales bacterium]